MLKEYAFILLHVKALKHMAYNEKFFKYFIEYLCYRLRPDHPQNKICGDLIKRGSIS